MSSPRGEPSNPPPISADDCPDPTSGPAALDVAMLDLMVPLDAQSSSYEPRGWISRHGRHLELDTLKQDVAAGAIDTVLVCFADLQGRLIGKRVTARIPVRSPEEDFALEDLHMEFEPRCGRTA